MTTRSRPTLLPALALAALVPVFIALGMWQSHRADEKQSLQDQYDQRASEPALQLGTSLQSAEALQFRHIVAHGKYDPDYQVLIDNRVHQSVAGYHVVTPLKLEGGDTRVLVNRGWVPLGQSRQVLPAIDSPAGAQEIRGVATVPLEKPFTLGAMPVAGWQPVWPHLDLKRYASSVPFAVQPIVILLDPDADAGFVRAWARLDAGITMHKGYAFQWFALAVVAGAAVIYLMMCRRPPQRRKRKR